ncbi:Aldehyde dehydrogenase N-terminal [Penicillium samsonianum]|uniref:Aldehyde dehydrogenase N-terminal n=1 Tax=Penicillium samsonianum TaxID=1882272 RepID=UPI002548D5C6|nr:Aldehyde dehydrogenase N-terminal [Penicillium samsonianum]KAJ6128063.1 Aldehyde dehydrogenase N-terminal [Penicillium samsonianum]
MDPLSDPPVPSDTRGRKSDEEEPGTAGFNCTSPTTAHDMPFGGYKCSGLGREGWVVSFKNVLKGKPIVEKVDMA